MAAPIPSFINKSIESTGPGRFLNYSGGLASTPTASGTLTLSITSAINQLFTGTTPGQIINVGDATQYNLGHEWWIYNDSSSYVSVRKNDGVSIIELAPDTRVKTICTDNTTTAGQWIVGIVKTTSTSGTLTAFFSSTASNVANKFLDTDGIATSDTLPAVAAISASISRVTFSGAVATPAGIIEVRVNTTLGLPAFSITLLGTQTQSSVVNYPIFAGDQINVKIAAGATNISKPLVKLYS